MLLWGFVGFGGPIPRSLTLLFSRIGSQTLVWLDWICGVALLLWSSLAGFCEPSPAYTALFGAL